MAMAACTKKLTFLASLSACLPACSPGPPARASYALLEKPLLLLTHGVLCLPLCMPPECVCLQNIHMVPGTWTTSKITNGQKLQSKLAGASGALTVVKQG